MAKRIACTFPFSLLAEVADVRRDMLGIGLLRVGSALTVLADAGRLSTLKK